MSDQFSSIFQNILPAIPPYFVGRLQELSILNDKTKNYKTFYISGPAGIGKTGLISKFSSQQPTETEKIYKRVQEGESLVLVLKNILASGESELSKLFPLLNADLSKSAKILVIDDFERLTLTEQALLITFFGEYYQGNSFIFIASRNSLESLKVTKITNICNLSLSSLEEKEVKELIKLQTSGRSLTKEVQEKIISFGKGNPFALSQLCMLETFSSNRTEINRQLLNRIFSDLTEEEISFLKIYSILDHDLKSDQLKNKLVSSSSLEKLAAKNLIIYHSHDFCHLSDLVKQALKASISAEEKTILRDKASTFLKINHETVSDIMILSRLLLELGDYNGLKQVVTDFIDIWIGYDVQPDLLIQILIQLKQHRGKLFLSEQLLYYMIQYYFRKNEFELIIQLIQEYEGTELFNVSYYWFLGISFLETYQTERAKEIISKMYPKNEKLNIRTEILKSRLNLIQMDYKDAFLKLKELETKIISDPEKQKFSMELKFIYNNLAEIHEELSEFDKAQACLDKSHNLSENIGHTSIYHSIIYRINKLYLESQSAGISSQLLQDFSLLEQDISSHFYYEYGAEFYLLKAVLLRKQGKLKAALAVYKEQFKTYKKTELVNKEACRLLLDYSEHLLNLNLLEEANELLIFLSKSPVPVIKSKCESLERLLQMLKFGKQDFPRDVQWMADYFLYEFPSLEFLNKPEWLIQIASGNFQKSAEDFDSKIMTLNQNRDFSFREIQELNLRLLIFLRTSQPEKARNYLELLKKMVEKADVPLIKWQVLIKIYAILIYEDLNHLKDLKNYLFSSDPKNYIKQLIISVFQLKPAMLIEDVLTRFKPAQFHMNVIEKQLFEFYVNFLQLNIVAGIILDNGTKKNAVSLYELLAILIQNRCLTLDGINEIIYGSSGEIMVRKNKQAVIYDMLAFFIQNKGRLMEKEHIIEKVWNKKYFPEADDTLLKVNIKRLRDLLGDSEKSIIINEGQKYGLAKAYSTFSFKFHNS